jgi:hypothetical protein
VDNNVDDRERAILSALSNPQRARVDNVDIQQATIYEQIAAVKFLAAIQAVRDPAKAFTRMQIVPPGSV